MKLKTKLLIIPSLLAFLITIIVFLIKADITKSIKKIINVNTEKIISMLEIEINLDEMHVSLYNTLNSYDEETTQFYLDKYADSILDQQLYLKQLAILTQDKKEQINFTELEKLLTKTQTIGEKILTIDKELKHFIQKRRDILNNNIEVELDSQLQKSLDKNDKDYQRKIEALLEIEINIHELISAVRGYIIKNDKFLLDRVKDSEADIKYWTDQLKKLSWHGNNSKTLNSLIVDLQLAQELSDKIIELRLSQEILLKEYKQIDIQLDDLIDNVVNKKILQEHKEFNEKFIQQFDWSTFAFILLGLVFILVLYKTTLTLLNNINIIITELSNYNIDKKPTHIKLKTNDEIEKLAQTINEMSSSVYESSEERNKLMKEMNTLNSKLENKIIEVNQKEEILSQYILFSRTDPKGIITYASQYFCNLSGYTRDELLGSPHSIVRHPETPKETFKEMWSTIQSGKEWRGEIKNRAKEGHHYWVYTTISPEYNKDGSLKGYISIREDITAKKEFEKQHTLLLEQAKLAAMGEMIGNIAHQWRQPLSVITTASSTIELKAELGTLSTQETCKLTQNIETSAQYLSKTIDTFRDFIKDEKIYKKVSIQDEIAQAINITSITLDSKHIQIKDNLNYDEPIYLNLVSGELPQVLINIINNAKDVILERKIQQSFIEINLHKTLKDITITIEDNAGGIAEDIIQRIFEPYFTTKHKSIGTGLGLHMSYKIITDSLKGKIWVKNTEKGAKFFIELPLDLED